MALYRPARMRKYIQKKENIHYEVLIVVDREISILNSLIPIHFVNVFDRYARDVRNRETAAANRNSKKSRMMMMRELIYIWRLNGKTRTGMRGICFHH